MNETTSCLLGYQLYSGLEAVLSQFMSLENQNSTGHSYDIGWNDHDESGWYNIELFQNC